MSLHGGHSGEFCDHAESTLSEMVAAAVNAGYHTFGVTEHAPRTEEYIYLEERAMGWGATYLNRLFAAYVTEVNRLAVEFQGRLQVLRGFEMEVVPASTYVSWMTELRAWSLPSGEPAFDYAVGSVHFVDGHQIDGKLDAFQGAINHAGSLEALVIRYYEHVAELATVLKPEVIGHFDLIKKNIIRENLDIQVLSRSAVTQAATRALSAVKDAGSILDFNLAGWRKKLGEPYPSPALTREACAMGIGFCFGDDSHRPTEVGAGLADGRNYLLENGVNAITALTKLPDGTVQQVKVPL